MVPSARETAVIILGLCVGCSGSTNSPVGSAGPQPEGVPDAHIEGALPRCSDGELDDPSAFAPNGADISFFASTPSAPMQYVNHCVRIVAGNDVGFYGDFALFPLAPDDDPENPLKPVSSGVSDGIDADLRVTFPKSGIYGFRCTKYPQQMWGTVKVTPTESVEQGGDHADPITAP